MALIKPVLLQNGRLTVAPVANTTWVVQALINGSNKNMATLTAAQLVNGTFSFTPPVGTTFYLFALSLVFVSSGTPDPTKFGNITALLNGIDVDVRSNGTLTNVCNIKDNADIVLTFFQSPIFTSSPGFLNSADCYMGSVELSSPIALKASTSDFIRTVVKSATTGSGTDLRIYAHLFKEIP